jgi:hypothetical protein
MAFKDLLRSIGVINYGGASFASVTSCLSVVKMGKTLLFFVIDFRFIFFRSSGSSTPFSSSSAIWLSSMSRS